MAFMICKRCGAEKERGEFYGTDTTCKKCRNKFRTEQLRQIRAAADAKIDALPVSGGTKKAPRFKGAASSASASDPIRVSGDIKPKIVITIDCDGLIAALRELIAAIHKEVYPCSK